MTKLKEIISAHLALVVLIEKDKSNVYIFPSSVRIRLSGDLRQTRPRFEDYVEQKNRLVESLGTKKADGTFIVETTSPNYPKFKEEHEALLNTEFEVAFPIVKMDELLLPTKEKDGAAAIARNQISIDLLTDLQAAGLVVE
jgi:hypothetical protein